MSPFTQITNYEVVDVFATQFCPPFEPPYPHRLFSINASPSTPFLCFSVLRCLAHLFWGTFKRGSKCFTASSYKPRFSSTVAKRIKASNAPLEGPAIASACARRFTTSSSFALGLQTFFLPSDTISPRKASECFQLGRGYENRGVGSIKEVLNAGNPGRQAIENMKREIASRVFATGNNLSLSWWFLDPTWLDRYIDIHIEDPFPGNLHLKQTHLTDIIERFIPI